MLNRFPLLVSRLGVDDPMSILTTLGGRPERLLELPLAGGVGGGRLTEEADAREFGWLACLMLAGLRLGGGGGGTCDFVLAWDFILSERGRVSIVEMLELVLSSSAFGERRPVSRVILDSETSCE